MPTLLNISWWAQLVVWFCHVREMILIHLKFSWGFQIHTKRFCIWPYNLAVGNIVSPDNPKCLICVYSNVTSLVNHLTLSAKENGKVYKRKPKTGQVLTNLVIYMTQFHGKMGLWAFTCTRHVTYPFRRQTSWIEPGSAKRSIVNLLRVSVRHQVLKRKWATLSVIMRQTDNCPQNASAHQ